MALLDDVKQALRINNTAMDTEVLDLIESAKFEMKNLNINIEKTITIIENQTPEPTEEVPNPEPILIEVEAIDPLIKRAIILYCKAHYGYENAEAERFAKSYEMLIIHLSLSTDYQMAVVTDE